LGCCRAILTIEQSVDVRALGGDVLPGQHLQRAAGVAHVEGGHEGARAIEIAGARHGVDLGHQGAGGAAIG